jgi:hypothetical protein
MVEMELIFVGLEVHTAIVMNVAMFLPSYLMQAGFSLG